jgi:hypothetical protein
MSKELRVTFVIGYKNINDAIIDRLHETFEILDVVEVNNVVDISNPMQFFKEDDTIYSEDTILIFNIEIDGYKNGEGVNIEKLMDYYAYLADELEKNKKRSQILFGVDQFNSLEEEPFDYIREKILEIDGHDIVRVDDVDFDDAEVVEKINEQKMLKDVNLYEKIMNMETDMTMFLDLVGEYSTFYNRCNTQMDKQLHKKNVIDIQQGFQKYFDHVLDDNKYDYE